MIRFFIILVFFSEMCVTRGDGVVQPHPVLAVRLGESVTLQCSYLDDDIEYMFWLKLNVGQIPLLITISLKFSSDPVFYNNFNSTRFKVKTAVGLSNLTILNIQSSDSAMYYCGTRRDYSIAFGAGTYLVIKGPNKKQSNSRTVVQQRVSDPVNPGDSVTLNCTVDSRTCAGEHSVYWFRHGSGESLPGLLYTHGNRSDECEKIPESGSPTHSCVYSLPKENIRSSDAGTYYCAVVTCGNILFGNGTQLDINDHSVDPLILGQAVSLGFCVIFIAVLLCTRNKNCTACVSQQGLPNSSGKDESGIHSNDAEAINYAALDFGDKKSRRERKKKEVQQDTVYSHVKHTDWQ